MMSPHVFDGEHGNALHAMQWNQASSRCEREVSWFSRFVVGTWSALSSYGRDCHSKLVFVQRRQDSCLVMSDNSGISSRLVRSIRMLPEVMQETKSPFLVATLILRFLSVFKNSQASSPFEALNSA